MTKKFVIFGKNRRLPAGRIIAPKVIARFGSMSALVTQVLEPTIGNYFRNAAQGSDIIDFLKNRSLRQGEARDSISLALKEYNVGAVDTLIGERAAAHQRRSELLTQPRAPHSPHR